jgi:DNA-binding IclR family transcriptional regulator
MKVQSKTPSRRNAAGLRRDLEVLEVLGSHTSIKEHGLGVNKVAELTGRDKGQISRTLSTLADAGFVERDRSSAKYRLGFQLYAMAARTKEARLVVESEQYLRKVVNRLHETAHLCVLRGGNVLTLKSELSSSAFRGVGWEGVSVGALRTSSGRALISDWSEAEVRDWYLEHAKDYLVVQPTLGLPTSIPESFVRTSAVTDNTKINSVEDLLKELEIIRKRGYAIVDEEFELGLVGASAPIRDSSNRIVGVINISAPKTQIGQHLEQVGSIVAEISRQLSKQLGATA